MSYKHLFKCLECKAKMNKFYYDFAFLLPHVQAEMPSRIEGPSGFKKGYALTGKEA